MNPGPFNAATAQTLFRKVAQRYRSGDRFTRHYVASKLKRDPVHFDLLCAGSTEGFGDLLDLGCGRGQTGILLLAAGQARSVVGFERDAGHVAQARLAGQGLPFRCETRDLVLPAPFPKADTILLIDVLYQLPTAVQETVLERAATSACSRIFIRTLDPARGTRSLLSRTLERVFRRIWPNAGSHVNPLAIPKLSAELDRRGFTVSEVPCWRGTPFANVLLVGTRRAAQPDSVTACRSRVEPPAA